VKFFKWVVAWLVWSGRDSSGTNGEGGVSNGDVDDIGSNGVAERGSCQGKKGNWEWPWRRKKKITKTILRDINLIFQPGRSYLLLGAPGSGTY